MWKIKLPFQTLLRYLSEYANYKTDIYDAGTCISVCEHGTSLSEREISYRSGESQETWHISDKIHGYEY